MYNSLKVQVEHGVFSVQDMQRRVKRLYALGDLSEEQLDELFTLIAEKANPESERPEALILIRTLTEKLETLTTRVIALERGDTGGGNDGDNTTESPAWEPWDGLSNQYQQGAIVSHGGRLWQSVFSGQNVWEPGVVDERFWVKYTPDA